MKKNCLLFIIFLTFNSLSFAQQTDENTLIINRYFQNAANEKQMTSQEKFNLSVPVTYVNLVQTGYNNSISVTDLQNGDKQIISQSGNQNNYEFYSSDRTQNTAIRVNQKGDMNALLIFGENSLMKNTVINQNSDFKSVIVKNYKN